MTTDDVLWLQFLVTAVGAALAIVYAVDDQGAAATVGLIFGAVAVASILYWWFRQVRAWIVARKQDGDDA